MHSARTYAEQQFDQFLESLDDYLRIPSISTLPEHRPDMERAARWTAEKMRSVGLSQVEIITGEGHPIIYGEYLGAPDAPTVLIYGHYDVQPPDPLVEWDQPPFEPVIRDNHVVARGAADDKGQVMINMAALESLKAANDGTLPLNIKFIVEGEEEIGSQSLIAFVEANQDRLQADVIVISDTTMLSLEQPAISISFRGLLAFDLKVKGPAFDLHSGQHGGVVHNPIQALCEIIAALHNPDGSVAVEGFYDKVRSLDEFERNALAELYSEDELRAETGAPESWGEAKYNLRERIVARPTLEANGIVGGWTGNGGKTVLPSYAIAKISCRLVPDQDPDEIEALVRQQIQKLTPPTVRSEIHAYNYSNPVLVSADNRAVQIAMDAYEKGFGVRPILMRKGGSLPIVSVFSETLNAPIVLAGYGLPSDRVHGPNERFHLDCFRRGIYTAIHLYDGLLRDFSP